MKKFAVVLLVVTFALTLTTTMIFAAETKTVEDMVTANNGCGVSCHKPEGSDNLKSVIKEMADKGNHANVAAMVSNEGPGKCKGCHSSNFGKVLHKKHLVGTPKNNDFLKQVQNGEANCISCHSFNAKKGTMGLD